MLGSTWIVWQAPRIGGGWPTITVIGVLVGVLTTSTGANGPPLVAAFQSLSYPARPFRATLAAIFTACGAAGVVLFFLGGEVRREALTLAMAGVPAVLLGWWAGDHVFRRIRAERFRTIVLTALVLASALTLIRTVI